MALASIVTATPAFSLPINFQYNQGARDFQEITSDNFHVYHETEVSGEGQAIANALEAGKPVLERWMESEIHTPVSVIMSAISSQASFANFLTNSIELQTYGTGGRDLAWHELTHTTMFAKLDNVMGPAGALVHLPWMPAWFLEGLAEATSVSGGSDVAAAIERYHAASGNWPTYDRLHSLYAASAPGSGYATAGGFATFVLKKIGPDRLPQLLTDFWDYTMPWWWAWSVVPFNRFLPFDAALENATGMTGEELYEAYKEESRKHWLGLNESARLVHAGETRRSFTSLSTLHSDGKNVLLVVADKGETYLAKVAFDPKSGWAREFKRTKSLPNEYNVRTDIQRPGLLLQVQEESDKDLNRFSTISISAEPSRPLRPLLTRRGSILDLFETARDLVWLEQDLATRKLCFTAKDDIANPKVTCPVTVQQPESLAIIGSNRSTSEQHLTRDIWIRRTVETPIGDRHGVLVFSDRKVDDIGWDRLAKPLQVAFAGPSTWVLTAERSYRTLILLDTDHRCRSAIPLYDFILDLQGLNDGSLTLSLYNGNSRYLKRMDPKTFDQQACLDVEGHTSPLLESMRDPGLSMSVAMARSNLWAPRVKLATPSRSVLEQAPSLDIAGPVATSPNVSEDRKWRAAPKLAFPWIGADDALGYQFGVVSVPLMDDMQNETVRLTLLYGVPSNFPYQEITLTSTRWKPTLRFAAYRQQTYNSQYFIVSEERIRSSYYDEKGGKFDITRGFRGLGGWLTLTSGLKYAHLKPYLGPKNIHRGFLAEWNAGVTLSHVFGPLSWSHYLQSDLAPEMLNETFDYNRISIGSTLSSALPFWSSRLSLGLEGSRTRGKTMFNLRELYRPLKTFVPGSGGGYNKNSFPIAGEGSLFTARLGDTQARAKANWTTPILSDIDQHFWILYMERLDFTAFYNYGSAWNGEEPRQGFNHLTRAHGYSLDLLLENKGVRFNIGLGAGQVVGNDFQIYMTSGFDALF